MIKTLIFDVYGTIIAFEHGKNAETVREFMKTLEEKHISVTRRREMGDDIEGACGQLRRAVISAE